jgi:hypothetical protein
MVAGACYAKSLTGIRISLAAAAQARILAGECAHEYAPIARMRVTNLFDRMPLEIVAAKRLGLYGYED